MSHSTHYRSFQGQSSQPVSWLLLAVFTGQMTQLAVSQHWRTKMVVQTRLQSHQDTPTCNNINIIISIKCNRKECMQTHLITVEWSHWVKTQSLTACKNCSYRYVHFEYNYHTRCNNNFPSFSSRRTSQFSCCTLEEEMFVSLTRKFLSCAAQCLCNFDKFVNPRNFCHNKKFWRNFPQVTVHFV